MCRGCYLQDCSKEWDVVGISPARGPTLLTARDGGWRPGEAALRPRCTRAYRRAMSDARTRQASARGHEAWRCRRSEHLASRPGGVGGRIRTLQYGVDKGKFKPLRKDDRIPSTFDQSSESRLRGEGWTSLPTLVFVLALFAWDERVMTRRSPEASWGAIKPHATSEVHPSGGKAYVKYGYVFR